MRSAPCWFAHGLLGGLARGVPRRSRTLRSCGPEPGRRQCRGGGPAAGCGDGLPAPSSLASQPRAWRTQLHGKSVKQAGVSPLGALTASTPWEHFPRSLLWEQASSRRSAWASRCGQLPWSALLGKFRQLAGWGGRWQRRGDSSFSAAESPPSFTTPGSRWSPSPLHRERALQGRQKKASGSRLGLCQLCGSGRSSTSLGLRRPSCEMSLRVAARWPMFGQCFRGHCGPNSPARFSSNLHHLLRHKTAYSSISSVFCFPAVEDSS